MPRSAALRKWIHDTAAAFAARHLPFTADEIQTHWDLFEEMTFEKGAALDINILHASPPHELAAAGFSAQQLPLVQTFHVLAQLPLLISSNTTEPSLDQIRNLIRECAASARASPTLAEKMVTYLAPYVLDTDLYKLSSDTSPHPITESSPDRPTVKYATLWTQDTPRHGKPIDRLTFQQLVTQKEDYTIFVIDRGEFRTRSIGEVYFNPEPVHIPTGTQGRPKSSLTPLEYRMLVHTLKRNGDAGSMGRHTSGDCSGTVCR